MTGGYCVLHRSSISPRWSIPLSKTAVLSHLKFLMKMGKFQTAQSFKEIIVSDVVIRKRRKLGNLCQFLTFKVLGLLVSSESPSGQSDPADFLDCRRSRGTYNGQNGSHPCSGAI